MDGQRRDRLIQRVLAGRTASGRAESGQALSVACVQVLPNIDGAALVLHGGSQAQELVGASDPWAAGIGMVAGAVDTDTDQARYLIFGYATRNGGPIRDVTRKLTSGDLDATALLL